MRGKTTVLASTLRPSVRSGNELNGIPCTEVTRIPQEVLFTARQHNLDSRRETQVGRKVLGVSTV